MVSLNPTFNGPEEVASSLDKIEEKVNSTFSTPEKVTSFLDSMEKEVQELDKCDSNRFPEKMKSVLATFGNSRFFNEFRDEEHMTGNYKETINDVAQLNKFTSTAVVDLPKAKEIVKRVHQYIIESTMYSVCVADHFSDEDTLQLLLTSDKKLRDFYTGDFRDYTTHRYDHWTYLSLLQRVCLHNRFKVIDLLISNNCIIKFNFHTFLSHTPMPMMKKIADRLFEEFTEPCFQLMTSKRFQPNKNSDKHYIVLVERILQQRIKFCETIKAHIPVKDLANIVVDFCFIDEESMLSKKMFRQKSTFKQQKDNLLKSIEGSIAPSEKH